MVKNKGFLPSGPSEIHIQRNQIKDIVFSLLPACVDPDPESNVPFKVNAIVANPPAYGKTISLMLFLEKDLTNHQLDKLLYELLML